MKRLQGMSWPVLGAILMLSGLCAAHIPTDVIYPITGLTDADIAAITLDGDLAEWIDIFGDPVLTGENFFADPSVGDGAPYDPADLSFNFRIGWHQQSGKLYVAVQRIDDVYINEYAGGNLGDIWRYDSIEFQIDGDHSGGDYSELGDPNWDADEQMLNDNRTAQHYVAIADAPDGKHIGYQGAGGGWVNFPPYTDAAGASGGSDPTSSVIEFYLTPFDDLIWNDSNASVPSDLAPDKIIGFNITVPDFDAGPSAYHAFHILTGQAQTWRYADRFVDGRLLAAVDPLPQIESVELYRETVFPDEPVNIHARVLPGSAAISQVQADIRLDGETTVLASISLLDDGAPPDAEAGDDLYSGQWAGTAQLGNYQIDLTAEDDDALQTAMDDAMGFQVAHTIISFPKNMLVSPEDLAFVSVPVLIEDDGATGYLTDLDFLSIQLEAHIIENGLEPIDPVVHTIGTIQDGLGDLDETWTFWNAQDENWSVNTALASSNSLSFPATNLRSHPAGPEVQDIFAYIDLEIVAPGTDRLDFNVSRVLFGENDQGIASVCCGSLHVGRGDIDDSRTIDSFDAALILMHVVRKVDLENPDDPFNDPVETYYDFTFPAVAGHMADVSGEKGTTAFDASLIMRREVGLIDYFPDEENAYRLWDPPAGWWKPPVEPPPLTKPVATARPMNKTIALGPVEKREDGLIAVPITIDNMEGVLAGSFALRFDPVQLRPVGVESTDLTENFLFADHVRDNTARVGFAGVEPASGRGALAALLFQPLTSEIERIGGLELVEAQLNESDIDVRIIPSPSYSNAALPQTAALYPNYPNPFNPSTSIRYFLPGEEKVQLSVYDLTGQRIRVLQDGPQHAGHHLLEWDSLNDSGAAVASGVYLLRLETERSLQTRKMSMIK
jgi:hypothetical protein